MYGNKTLYRFKFNNYLSLYNNVCSKLPYNLIFIIYIYRGFRIRMNTFFP